MVEIIELAIIMFISFFAFFRIDKIKREKEVKDSWHFECRECLHGIQEEFRHECEKCTQKMISAYCSKTNRYFSYPPYTNAQCEIMRQYRDSIRTLKDKYLSEINTKVTERMNKYQIVAIPDSIMVEYKRNIDDIADTFYQFGNFIYDEMSMNK